jgi:predicted transcriptional regulator
MVETPMATDRLDDLVRRAADWPEEDILELANYARAIEARRTGVYQVSDEEWAAIEEGLRQAAAGDFVADEDLRPPRKRATA